MEQIFVAQVLRATGLRVLIQLESSMSLQGSQSYAVCFFRKLEKGKAVETSRKCSQNIVEMSKEFGNE